MTGLSPRASCRVVWTAALLAFAFFVFAKSKAGTTGVPIFAKQMTMPSSFVYTHSLCPSPDPQKIASLVLQRK